MSEVIQRTAEEVQEIAAGLGLVAILPRENELLLDIDQPTWIIEEKFRTTLADNGFQIKEIQKTRSKSGKLHVYLSLNQPVTLSERIVLQAVLGSDPIREVLSMLRLRQGSDAPTALFESKAWVNQIQNWRKRCDLKAKANAEDIFA